MVFVPGLAYHLFSKSNNEKFHHLNFNGQLKSNDISYQRQLALSCPEGDLS